MVVYNQKSLGVNKCVCSATFGGQQMCTIVPTLIENDVLAIDSREKASIFKDYFVVQGRLPGADTLPPSVQLYTSARDFFIVSVEEEKIFRLMENVDITKASVCDGFGNRIIKLCAKGHLLCPSFTKLINRSFALGKHPSQWKLANVIPLYKNDNRQFKTNYRPISLLPCLSKLYEKVVFKRLYDYLIEIGFLYSFQSGFRPRDSTVNQLLYLVHQIYLVFERGKEVRVVYLYISKAFGCVWHRGLLKKLESLGTGGSLLHWFESYFQDRMQRVVLEGQSSEWKKSCLGVPQGSVLGPLLFLKYINNITNGLELRPFIYADDTTLLYLRL